MEWGAGVGNITGDIGEVQCVWREGGGGRCQLKV